MWLPFLLLIMASGSGKNPNGTYPFPRRGKKLDEARLQMVELIRHVARAKGVPEQYALAFADCESGFDPNARGDRQWHLKNGGANYRREVLGKLPNNPFKDQPELWCSYGLFGLLAAFQTGEREDPRVLLDPRINAERGCRKIRNLLESPASRGDIRRARLLYVGCGADGQHCADSIVSDVLARLDAALERWA